LAAAALAAAYPNLWAFDGTLAAETTSLLTVALVLLAAYRLWDRRSVGAAVALGLACAVAALARAEALLLLPLIVVPLALTQRSLDLRQRVSLVVLPALAALALLAPWLAFNATRFNHPVLGTSTGFPLALVQANCDATYYGSFVGYYSFGCIPSVPDPEADETEQAEHYRQVAVEYVKANAERVPAVVLARLGRTFGLYQPFEQVKVDIYVDVRQPLVAWSGLATYYLLVAGAVVGVGVLHRRQVPLSPMVAVVAIVLVAVALTFGQTRYRSSAEVVLVVLAGVAVDDLLSRRRRLGGTPVPADDLVIGEQGGNVASENVPASHP
jgi:4-amino-4-deoxy-L-arabinose transferase-like glycosyltransferase